MVGKSLWAGFLCSLLSGSLLSISVLRTLGVEITYCYTPAGKLTGHPRTMTTDVSEGRKKKISLNNLVWRAAEGCRHISAQYMKPSPDSDTYDLETCLLDTGFCMYPRLALNLQESSWLSLWSTGVTVLCHHTWLETLKKILHCIGQFVVTVTNTWEQPFDRSE